MPARDMKAVSGPSIRYLVFELVEGETLAARIERGARNRPPVEMIHSNAAKDRFVSPHVLPGGANLFARPFDPARLMSTASERLLTADVV